MEKNIIEVFIFCWCPDGWLPRAIIVDYSKLDAQLKDDIKFLVKHGSLIEKINDIIPHEKTFKYLSKGYKINDKIFSIEDNKRLSTIITNWAICTDSAHKDLLFADDSFQNKNRVEQKNPKNEWIYHSYEFHINENMEPNKLREVLSKMAKLPSSSKPYYQMDQKKETESTIFNSVFKVKHCVLISDVPINENKK